MSKGTGKGKRSGAALGGLVLTTFLVVMVAAAAGWFGAWYYYDEQRKVSRQRLLDAVEWSPERVARDDAKNDCDGARLREESELRQKEVSAFELSKLVGFNQAPSQARARGLSRTIKQLKPSQVAFLESYGCAENSALARDGREQQLSGVVSASGYAVGSWIDSDRIPNLFKVLWIGRDIQATEGLYQFQEGTQVMDVAYTTLADHLESGALDVQLDSTAKTLEKLIANEESAQLQWQAGARTLLADLYGTEWDQNPPTPLRARVMVESVDGLVDGLNAMPDVASQPYPERKQSMTKWLEENDMTDWDPRFSGFGKAGMQIDAEATRTHAKGRALLVGIGLRKFKKQRGYCPRELEDLVEMKMLGELPLDPITNQPFTYDARTCSIQSGEIEPGGAITIRAMPEES